MLRIVQCARRMVDHRDLPLTETLSSELIIHAASGKTKTSETHQP